MNRRGLIPWSVAAIALAASLAFGQEDSIVTHDSWWLPPNRAVEGEKVDMLFNLIFTVTVVILVAVHVALVVFLIRYRQRDGRRATFIHGHHKAEVIWTVTPALVLVLMGILSIRVWGQLRMDKPDPRDVVHVDVLAQQFQWNVRYPGRDGKLGTRDDIGTFDLNDPEKSPIIGTIHVPVNRTVLVHLRSKDVLHSFYLPNMRTKMDAVPGLTGQLWFTPTQTGRYEIACAELCGPQHYTMRGELIVMEQDEFDAWMAEREEEIAELIGEEEEATEEEGEEEEEPAEESPAEPAGEESGEAMQVPETGSSAEKSSEAPAESAEPSTEEAAPESAEPETEEVAPETQAAASAPAPDDVNASAETAPTETAPAESSEPASTNEPTNPGEN